AIMKSPIASALCATGAMPRGSSQKPNAPAPSAASMAAVRRSTDREDGAATATAAPPGASTGNGLSIVDELSVAHRMHRREHFDHLGIMAHHDHGLPMLGGERCQQLRDRRRVG